MNGFGLLPASMAAFSVLMGAMPAQPAHAQGFPSKPVTLLVSSAPGAGVDFFARDGVLTFFDGAARTDFLGVRFMPSRYCQRARQVNLEAASPDGMRASRFPFVRVRDSYSPPRHFAYKASKEAAIFQTVLSLLPGITSHVA